MSGVITQRRPVYLENGKPGQPPHYLIDLPWVETSGSERSPYEYNNGVHAAIHSLIAALMCDKKKDVHFWLSEANRQVSSAFQALNKRGALVVPVPRQKKGGAK